MRVMISCGEPSGDLYAGALAAELRARVPSIEIAGLGGPRLQAAGATLSGHFTGLTVTGLTEVVAVLPRSWRMYRRLVSDARARRPDVFVAIDFSGFNFRLMAALRRLGIPVVYYVSPQVWAWRSHRIQTMKRLVDKVLVIFPFEAPVYERAGVQVQFVGHPLVDLARPEQPRTPFLGGLGLRPDARTVALLPGSRPNELQRIATTMAESAAIIRARVSGVQFVVARAPNLPDFLFAPFPPDVAIVEGKTDDVLAASDVVITASGTATVQAALHGKPMVVVYRVSPLTYRLGKPFVTLDTYAMVNLVAGRRIVPELIQMDFTAERVAHEAIALLTDADRHARTRDALRDVCQRLGTPGASGRAADAILEVAGRVPYGARSA
jgi:lipid-A-disaccharide synthase